MLAGVTSRRRWAAGTTLDSSATAPATTGDATLREDGH